MVEKREAPEEATEAPEAQDPTEDEEEAVVVPQPMIEVGFCKLGLQWKMSFVVNLPSCMPSILFTVYRTVLLKKLGKMKGFL